MKLSRRKKAETVVSTFPTYVKQLLCCFSTYKNLQTKCELMGKMSAKWLRCVKVNDERKPKQQSNYTVHRLKNFPLSVV